jgi:hypothetical protein
MEIGREPNKAERIMFSLAGIQGKIDRHGDGHRKYKIWMIQLRMQRSALERYRYDMEI